MEPVMNRAVEWLAGMLSADERDAVLGDLAEAHAGPTEAVRELLGLLVRRQIELWSEWRPWLVLGGLVAPCALLLNYLASRDAHRTAIYLWMYLNNWDGSLLRYSAFRHGLLVEVVDLAVSWFGLMLWAWMAGRILRSTECATRVVGILAFGLLLFLVNVPAAPAMIVRPGFSGANHAVFALGFYRVVYPQLIKAALVMLPYWRGTA
jgi:hypothetical protein